MKQQTILICGLLSLVLFFSCKKEEERVFLKTGQPGTLAASRNTLVLNSANAADTVLTFSWEPTSYGFQAAVRYTLELAKAGTNFASPTEVAMGSSRSKAYTTAEINQAALIMGLAPGSAGQMEARVRSVISDSITAVYTNTVRVTLTPYLVIINYPSLYVPGDHQGWSPSTADKISSKFNDGKYEGYVYLGSGSLQFKYTSAPDWNNIIYGWAGSTTSGNDVSGTMASPGGNLFVPTTGNYLLKANTTANTWSATKITSWGLIGEAVPTTGWTTDRDLSFNPSTKLWTITLDLNAGVVKFRANDAWTINFGDTNADLFLDYDGANIAVPSAGNYTMTLDLRVPWNYTYRLVKN